MEKGWLYRIPTPVRHFLGRRLMDFRHSRNWLFFMMVDVIALSFVRRGHSGAILVVKNDRLGDYVLFRDFLAAIKTHPPYQGRPLVFCGNTQPLCVPAGASPQQRTSGWRTRAASHSSLWKVRPC